MSGGIDKLSDQIADIAASNVQIGYMNWEGAITSPIERVFAIGVMSLIEIDMDYFLFTEAFLSDGRSPPAYFESRSAINGTVVVEFQKKEIDWVADFVLSVPTYCDKKVIVECDGHDFHERTKEQASRDRSRDRAAQAAGYTILRFTGSEIYRDPLKCVREALNALREHAQAIP